MSKQITIKDLRKKAQASKYAIDDIWYSEDELLTYLENDLLTYKEDSSYIAAASPTTVLALIERVEEHEACILQIQALADWHDTKAYKARKFRPVSQAAIMDKAAQVHEDAARHIRKILTEVIGEQLC